MDPNKIVVRHEPDICAILMHCATTCSIATKDQDGSLMPFEHLHWVYTIYY